MKKLHVRNIDIHCIISRDFWKEAELLYSALEHISLLIMRYKNVV